MSEEDPSQPPAKSGVFDRLRALFGLTGPSIRDDIKDALQDEAIGGDISPKERSMLKNVLGLHEVRVGDVMVPRADIISVSLETSLADVLATFRTAGHSRLPVYGETLDDPRGMVHIRDFVDYIATVTEAGIASQPMPRGESTHAPSFQTIVQNGGLDLTRPLSGAAILRPVLFAPPSMPALDLLVKMQSMRTHMALVIDEYGGTDGLVSIENIVEVIVGDIDDEHDEDESPEISALPDGSYIANARALLEDVREVTGIDFSQVDKDLESDTLGGLITTLLGRVPVRGEIIPAATIEFEILDADPRKIKRVKLHRSQPQAEQETVKTEPSQS